MLTNRSQNRAWIEVDLSALTHNLSHLRSQLPQGCEVMPVVKADAYGHGAVKVAQVLQNEGVCIVAVATVDEAVQIRDVFAGDILVMGATCPADAGILESYRLTQIIVNSTHAKAFNDTGHRLNVHIAADTGMHRLGMEDLREIECVFAHENLKVTGMATHLAVPDSYEKSDIDFTNAQCEKFFDIADALEQKGYDAGKLHIQSSYGLLKHPKIQRVQYVRPGIALYGAIPIPGLKPVLSLRARIGQVRQIGAGESVSYGRTFVSKNPMKIATVSIGYADGVPRQMTSGECVVRDCRVPIIGRICMDMFMIDVTGIDDIATGDIVTLIGDGICCENFAQKCDTITHEILSRLGLRLPKIYVASAQTLY